MSPHRYGILNKEKEFILCVRKDIYDKRKFYYVNPSTNRELQLNGKTAKKLIKKGKIDPIKDKKERVLTLHDKEKEIDEIVIDNYLDKEEDCLQYKINEDVEKCLNAWEEFIKMCDVVKISPTILINDYFKNNPKLNSEEFKQLQNGDKIIELQIKIIY